MFNHKERRERRGISANVFFSVLFVFFVVKLFAYLCPSVVKMLNPRNFCLPLVFTLTGAIL